jgi:hypothetical protein
MPIRPIYHGVKKLGAMRIALLYCAFATIWILTSSYVVNFTVQDADTLARLELLKGLLFVFVTSGLLYLALRLSRAHGSSQEVQADLTKPARKAGIVLLFIAMTLVVPLIGFPSSNCMGRRLSRMHWRTWLSSPNTNLPRLNDGWTSGRPIAWCWQPAARSSCAL